MDVSGIAGSRTLWRAPLRVLCASFCAAHDVPIGSVVSTISAQVRKSVPLLPSSTYLFFCWVLLERLLSGMTGPSRARVAVRVDQRRQMPLSKGLAVGYPQGTRGLSPRHCRRHYGRHLPLGLVGAMSVGWITKGSVLHAMGVDAASGARPFVDVVPSALFHFEVSSSVHAQAGAFSFGQVGDQETGG